MNSLENSDKKILLTRPLPIIEQKTHKVLKRKNKLKKDAKLPQIKTSKQVSICDQINLTEPKPVPNKQENLNDLYFCIKNSRDITLTSPCTTAKIISKRHYRQIMQHLDEMTRSFRKEGVSNIILDHTIIPQEIKLIPDYQQLCGLAVIIEEQLISQNFANKLFIRKISRISTHYPYYYFANFINCRVKEFTSLEKTGDISPAGPSIETPVRKSSVDSDSMKDPSIKPTSSKCQSSEKNCAELNKFGTRSSSPFGQLYGTTKHSPAELTVLCKSPNTNFLNLQAFFISQVPELILSVSVNLTHLNLSYNLFKEIPACVFSMLNLEFLSIRSNPIKEIPPQISALTNLRFLDASYCQISKISKRLYSLECMERLWVSFNELTFISQDISNLRNLKDLQIEANCLIGLPLRMKEMSIDSLIIRGNRLHSVFAEENAINVPNTLKDLCYTEVAQQCLARGESDVFEECEPCTICERPMYGIGTRVIKLLENNLSKTKLPFLLATCGVPCYEYLVTNKYALEFVINRIFE